MIINCNKLAKSFGATEILKDVSFVLNEKDKLAIIGVNGAGKSTLLKLVVGQLEADQGDIAIGKNTSIGYLSQKIDLDDSLTLYEGLLEVFNDLIEMEIRLNEMEIEMKTNHSSDFIEKYTRLEEEYGNQKGYEYKSRIKGIIKGLGFSDDDHFKKIRLMSGGEKRRVLLGRLLLQEPDLLLLDEPTNHLDLNSIEWLENYITSLNKTVIIVTHDRFFIDSTCNKILEIENGKSKIYDGDFTTYSVQKEIEQEIQLKQFANQQKEIERQTAIIKKLKQFNREKSVKRARSREKLLAKMDVMDRPESLPNDIRFSLKPLYTSGNDVLKIENLSKGFDDRVLFKDISFSIFSGDKVALLGDNGIGKTTLFKILLKIIPKECGIIEFGSNVNIAYYDQEHNNIDDSNTIFDEIRNSYPKLTNTQIRNTLAAFVFTGDDVFKKISSLSGGEKGRVSLAKLMLSSANFLLLDEPTNHLDMASKEILENAISAYEGTVFYISHDRYFINSTATKVFTLTQNGLDIFHGNYDYYMEKRIPIINELKKTESTDTRENVKAQQREQRKLAKDLEKTEIEIENLEKKILEIEEKLNIASKENNLKDIQDLFNEKENLRSVLDDAFLKWEELSLLN